MQSSNIFIIYFNYKLIDHLYTIIWYCHITSYVRFVSSNFPEVCHTAIIRHRPNVINDNIIPNDIRRLIRRLFVRRGFSLYNTAEMREKSQFSIFTIVIMYYSIAWYGIMKTIITYNIMQLNWNLLSSEWFREENELL